MADIRAARPAGLGFVASEGMHPTCPPYWMMMEFTLVRSAAPSRTGIGSMGSGGLSSELKPIYSRRVIVAGTLSFCCRISGRS